MRRLLVGVVVGRTHREVAAFEAHGRDGCAPRGAAAGTGDAGLEVQKNDACTLGRRERRRVATLNERERRAAVARGE